MYSCDLFPGPTNPVIPDNNRATNIHDNRATIQWTVPSIAYTPETYVVEYGTSQDSLGLTSGSQHSGPDITATDVTYSLQLSNLEPATTYHYRVVATNTADRTTASDVQSFMTGDSRKSTDAEMNVTGKHNISLSQCSTAGPVLWRPNHWTALHTDMHCACVWWGTTEWSAVEELHRPRPQHKHWWSCDCS